MRPGENRQHLAAAIETGGLRIGARDVPLQQHAGVASGDEKRAAPRSEDWLRYESAYRILDP